MVLAGGYVLERLHQHRAVRLGVLPRASRGAGHQRAAGQYASAVGSLPPGPRHLPVRQRGRDGVRLVCPQRGVLGARARDVPDGGRAWYPPGARLAVVQLHPGYVGVDDRAEARRARHAARRDPPPYRARREASWRVRSRLRGYGRYRFQVGRGDSLLRGGPFRRVRAGAERPSVHAHQPCQPHDSRAVHRSSGLLHVPARP